MELMFTAVASIIPYIITGTIYPRRIVEGHKPD